jgi:hypothetical protein
MDCITVRPILIQIDHLITLFFKDSMEAIKNNIRESFPVKGVIGDQQAIYLFHPHGMFSLSHLFHIGSGLTDWPVKSIRGTLHANFLKLPFFKDFCSTKWVASQYELMKKVLEDKGSLSVSLGGKSEGKYIHTSKLTLIVKKRVGIFKMALETGVPLIPVLVYGEHTQYKRSTGAVFDILKLLTGIDIVFPTLQSLMEWCSIYKTPLTHTIDTHVGEPVSVGPAHTPTDKEIVTLRNRYIVELKKLYAKTKPEGYDAELEII